MLPNPYVAQQLVELKIQEARREAEKGRLLAEAGRSGQSRNQVWGVLAAAAVVGIVLFLVI